jgi:hypothetical protein
MKKRVLRSGGFRREFSHLEVIPTIMKHIRGVHLAKGGNILEYEAKAKALPKIRHSHPSSTLAS